MSCPPGARSAFVQMLAGAAAVAASLAAPVSASPGNRDLVELTDIDSLSASPDGRFALFRTERASVSDNEYRLEWHVVDLRSGEVRRVGDGGQPIYDDPGLIEAGDALWLPDGRSVLFRALVDGALGVWKASLDGGAAVPLIVRDEDVEDMALGPGGDALLYRVGPSRAEIERAERREYDSGILVDGSIDLAQNLYRGGSVSGRMASQRLTGFWYDRAGLLWRAPRQQRRYEFATGRDQAAGADPPSAVPPDGGFAARAVSATGEVAGATWDGFAGSLGVMPAGAQSAGGKVECKDPLCRSRRISSLVWRPGARQLLVTFTDRQRRQSLYLWDLGSNRLGLLAGASGLLAGGRRNGLPCAITASEAICVAAGPISPPLLVAVNLSTGAERILFDPNARMRRDYRSGVEFMELKGASGTSFTAVLLTPLDRGWRKLPLFINYYSCEGFLRGGEGDEWPMPALLDAGFAVACVNSPPFRGAQDAAQIYRTALDGVGALIRTLADRGLVDRSRVAMGGLSFGSEAAMWIAMHSPLLAALSISSAQVEPAEYWLSAVPGTDHAYFRRKVWGLGPPGETRDQWRLLSPALNAGRINAPILFQLPEQEARRMPELYARLAAARVPVELYAFPDEAHIKLQPRHRLAVYDRNLDWFRYWLQDYRDPAPLKLAQYQRWDRLRALRPPRQAGSATSGAIAQAPPSR